MRDSRVDGNHQIETGDQSGRIREVIQFGREIEHVERSGHVGRFSGSWPFLKRDERDAWQVTQRCKGTGGKRTIAIIRVSRVARPDETDFQIRRGREAGLPTRAQLGLGKEVSMPCGLRIKDAQKPKCIGLIGIDRENLPIEQLGLAKTTGAVAFEGFLEASLNRHVGYLVGVSTRLFQLCAVARDLTGLHLRGKF
jgi:hypothetical protein